MNIPLLIAVTAQLAVLATCLSDVCQPPCRCRYGTLDCAGAVQMISLPDLTTHRFTAIRALNSRLLDLTCKQLLGTLRMLDIRGTDIPSDKACRLLRCRRVTRVKLSQDCRQVKVAADPYSSPQPDSNSVKLNTKASTITPHRGSNSAKLNKPVTFAPLHGTDSVKLNKDSVKLNITSTTTPPRGSTSSVTAVCGSGGGSDPVTVVCGSSGTITSVMFVVLGSIWSFCSCFYYHLKLRRLRNDTQRQFNELLGRELLSVEGQAETQFSNRRGGSRRATGSSVIRM